MANDLMKDLEGGISGDELRDRYGISDPAEYLREEAEDEGYNVSAVYISAADDHLYFLSDGPTPEVTNHVEKRRTGQKAKQTITKQANRYLEEIEDELKSHREDVGPVEWDSYASPGEGTEDMVIHRTDDHFGEVVKNIDGEVIYDTDIAEERVYESIDKILAKDEARASDTETAHLLLGGDIVTNEAIYEEQPHHIDAYIDQQLNTATSVYDDVIEELSDRYERVQVVCQSGNHGEFRVSGSSGKANADDLLYDRLELLSAKAGYDNVQFVKSDRKDHVNFDLRDWNGHLRHGQHVRNHIGTSSPMSDWLSFLDAFDFDIAYRGHYHEAKLEPVNGRPVLMGASQKPEGEYEGTLAIFGNGPKAHVHWADDELPLTGSEFVPLEGE